MSAATPPWKGGEFRSIILHPKNSYRIICDVLKREKSMKRTFVLVCNAVIAISALLAAQQRQALQLPAPSEARPNPGQNIAQPEAAMPTAPSGFTVDVYFDNIQAPRMMEWASNAELFVTQTQPNNGAVPR